MGFKRIFLVGLFIFGVGVGDVFARGDSMAYIPVDKLDTLTTTPVATTDFVGVYDASAKADKKIDAAKFSIVGTDTYALSAATPGTGTLDLVEIATYVFSDAAGDGPGGQRRARVCASAVADMAEPGPDRGSGWRRGGAVAHYAAEPDSDLRARYRRWAADLV